MALIDRGRVMADYLENLGRKDSYKAKYEALSKAVDEATVVDAAPVVHAKWEYLQYDTNPRIGNWHCSKCRKIMPPHMVAFAKYCPGCGAKMDEETAGHASD